MYIYLYIYITSSPEEHEEQKANQAALRTLVVSDS